MMALILSAALAFLVIGFVLFTLTINSNELLRNDQTPALNQGNGSQAGKKIGTEESESGEEKGKRNAA